MPVKISIIYYRYPRKPSQKKRFLRSSNPADGFVDNLDDDVLAVDLGDAIVDGTMNTEIKPFGPEFGDYLHDESRRAGSADRIVFARGEEDVRAALQSGLPITVQGARTGLTAGAVPEGGLILNLSRMNEIGEVQGGRITVQPGALLSEIRDVAAEHSLFFPPDPTETSASIGGMLACNASGALSYHYGATRNWVHALRIMLPDGDVLRLERGQVAKGRSFSLVSERGRTLSGKLPNLQMPNVKSAAGYFVEPDMDLVDLFVGMEGTLGVITEAELKLIPVPPVQQALCAFFPNEDASLAFVRFLREELKPVAIEFFGHRALDLLRNSEMELPDLPAHFHTAIYFEFHGENEALIERAVMAAAEKMIELGASDEDCWMADGPRELEIHKAFRHATPEAVNLRIDQRKKDHPGLTKLGTDMSVPDDTLETIMQLYRDDLADTGLEYVIFGHIGNNHVHVNILPRNMQELAQGKALYEKWAEAVVVMGGSVSAEHGIGKIKVALLEKMYGSEGISAMRDLKSVFDPEGRLNPGNLFRSCQKV
jgi:D-lactate dehydrogenase (cytochrome)